VLANFIITHARTDEQSEDIIPSSANRLRRHKKIVVAESSDGSL